MKVTPTLHDAPWPAYLSLQVIATFRKVEPPKVCHFLKLPLEVRNEIYKVLLTTSYCTYIKSNGTTLKFKLCGNILQVNKEIHQEAKKILIEANDFVVFKVNGLNLQTENIPVFKDLQEEKIKYPVLRVEVKFPVRRGYIGGTDTLITTAEGLQPLLNTLWKLDMNGLNINMLDPRDSDTTVHPSDLKLSLHFSIRAPMRSEFLRNNFLKPWKRLHGIGKLTLTGDVGDQMTQLLTKNMVKGPSSTDVVCTLNTYFSLGKKETRKRNYTIAQWYWNLYRTYCRHLRQLRSDPLFNHDLKDAKHKMWAEVWAKFEGIFFQCKLRIMKQYIHQYNYKLVVVYAEQARCARVFPFDLSYKPSELWTAKFYLCEAMAHNALGDTDSTINSLVPAAKNISSSLGQGGTREVRYIGKCLHMSINEQLLALNSPYHNSLELPLTAQDRTDSLDGIESCTFWDWINFPED
jgi:hypothetical protein